MNENRVNPMDLPDATDDRILAGLRRRMSAVEPLLPPVPAWVGDRGEVADGVRYRMGSRAKFAIGPVLLVAVLAFAVGLGFGALPRSGNSSPTPGSGAPLIRLVYRIVPPEGQAVTETQLAGTASVLAARASILGVQVQIEQLPPDKVEIDAYGKLDGAALDDASVWGSELAETGHLEIVPLPVQTYGTAENPGPADVPGAGSAIDPALPAKLTNSGFDPSGAKATLDTGMNVWVVDFKLTAKAAEEFGTYTSAHKGEFFAIVLDGKVISAPYIQEPITDGRGQIAGGFTAGSARAFAAVIQAGELPLPLKMVSMDKPNGSLLPPQYLPSKVPTSGRTIGSASAPVTLDVWVDFRCTTCASFARDIESKLIENLVRPGKLKIVEHDFIVIDASTGSHESRDAAAAALCAADQDAYWTYAAWLFANQSPKEEPGSFTTERLVEIAGAAGLDVPAFESCLRSGKHAAEVDAESQTAANAGYNATPWLTINGKTLDLQTLGDDTYSRIEAAVLAAMPSLTPTVAPSSSPSPSLSSSSSPAALASETPASQRTFMVYIVKHGDTVSGIASKFGITLELLLAANPTIVDPNHIVVGQELLIPWPGWSAPPTQAPAAGITQPPLPSAS